MAEMTVAEALELPVLRRGLPEVVAGADALDQPIRWVHAGEVPDIASLLRGGELLLTTGMGIRSAGKQRKFIADLSSRGVAGLVVELGAVFVEGLPGGLVKAAKEHDLPLIELHATVQFVAVTEAIHTEIVNQDFELLRRAEELHREFAQTMLAGKGVPAVLSLLARTIGDPVFLETHDGRLLAHAAPGADEGEDLVGAWADAGKQVGALGAAAPVPSGGSEADGRLVALPLEAPFDAFTQVAVERAAEIVALALLRSRQEDELLALGRGDLLARLAEGRIDPAMAAARAADMGFVDRKLEGLLPISARLRTGRAQESSGRPGPQAPGASWIGALRDLEREITRIGAPTLAGLQPVSGDLTLLVGLPPGTDREHVADSTAAILRAVARRAGAEVVVAAGAVCGWPEVGDGLRDAIEAAAVASDLPEAPWYDATAMPLDRLLWRLGDNEHLRRFVERVLGPLLEYDASHKHKLLPTLETLASYGGQKAAAARALNLNRQALYARIDRLERVLGMDLSDSETLASIDFALRARRHLRQDV